MSRRLTTAWAFALISCLGASPAAAEDFDDSERNENQVIVRATPVAIEELAQSFDLAIVSAVDQDEDDLFLIQGPADQSAEALVSVLSSDPAVTVSEVARFTRLPELESGVSASTSIADILDDLDQDEEHSTAFLASHGLTSAWAGYSNQEAATVIRLHEAHAVAVDPGPVTIAFIDTGVDPAHPLLAPALVEGFDFLLDRPGDASEWTGLEQSLAVILEQSLAVILEQSLAVILEGEGQPAPLNQSTALVAEPSATAIANLVDLPPAFGHGTMVAGLLRLVAPHARLMPLKAFDAQGRAHIFDIVRALYYAVDHGADVINMSFSTAEVSPELERALEYAQDHGVVCIAAAGNLGQETLVFPAALDWVLGVASTSNLDLLSSFSNYGTALASLGAPGEGLISTYPGGHYAAGWGTSFSTALVSGTVALLSTELDSRESALMESAVALPWSEELLDSGRLDVLNVVAED